MTIIRLLAVALLCLSQPAFAEKKKAPQPKQAAASPQALFDAWYTITVGAGTPDETRYGYYNDRAESKEGKVYYLNKVWKLEEGFLNEEQLGAVSLDDADLTPQHFNFHSNYRSVETTIDGSVQNGKVLTINVRQGNGEPKRFKKVLPAKTYYEIFFPLWLGRRIASFQAGKSVSFSTILEDSIETQFEIVQGRVKVEPADEYAKKSGTTRVSVDYRGVKTFWWVDSSGVTTRIENPKLGQVVSKVDRSVAEAFLIQK
ncbi:MAG TPA: hypothetical protein VM598_14980 [Bdellovibrionota bacterium]|nr:hypothetical protein [Bdellovibrionota bacterium]